MLSCPFCSSGILPVSSLLPICGCFFSPYTFCHPSSLFVIPSLIPLFQCNYHQESLFAHKMYSICMLMSCRLSRNSFLKRFIFCWFVYLLKQIKTWPIRCVLINSCSCIPELLKEKCLLYMVNTQNDLSCPFLLKVQCLWKVFLLCLNLTPSFIENSQRLRWLDLKHCCVSLLAVQSRRGKSNWKPFSCTWLKCQEKCGREKNVIHE